MVTVLSIGVAHDDENNQMESCTDILEKQYTNIQAEDIKYELEYKLKNLGNFLLLEIEVEKNFLEKKHTDFQIANAAEPIVRKAAKNRIDDLKKPVRVIVEYEDKNIFMKKY